MHARTLTATLTAAVATAFTAVVLVAPAAQAADSVRFDASAFDNAPVVTGSGYTMSGAISGELGGHLTLSVGLSIRW